jgi:TetR/AcrR family transcriptional regulator, transcriptional repressor for nem operon
VKRTPTTRRGSTTVERVLVAACDLFGKHGIRAVSLEQIESRAGVGRSQLYFFFDGKADLVAEVVRSQVRLLLDAQQPLLDAVATGTELRAAADAAVEQYEGESALLRCPIGSLAYELGDGDVRARRILAEGFDDWRAMLEMALCRVASAGELRPHADPAAVADALLAAYQGGVLIAAVSGDLTSLRRALSAICDAAIAGPDRTPSVVMP